MQPIPRVAFLADSFHEVNGAALTCRELAAFAKRRGYPFLSARFARKESFEGKDPFWTLEMKRGPFSVPVDPDLQFDLMFYRQRRALAERLTQFGPDLIHVMGPGELGILGAIEAHRLKIPLVASWHTNVHQYAARRAPFGNTGLRNLMERFVLNQVMRVYGRSAVALAPSQELLHMLQSRTGKPIFLMGRGVDTDAFSPVRRRRRDSVCVIGYIGRLMPEKGVRLFRRLEDYLIAAGESNFRFFIAGWGSEAAWLRRQLRNAQFEEILDPERLGQAYADMDIFFFPSRTDTFGNVVQEALASGVPAVVTDCGGPKTIVGDGVSGLVASSDEEICRHVLRLLRNPEERKSMGAAGRACMLNRSWDSVFEEVYRAYSISLGAPRLLNLG
jgi:glycosyltransferase involved in cell wall biosynthesis